MWPWDATSACIAFCTTRASAAGFLAESHEIPELVKAVTDYVARRLVERERALDEDPDFITRIARPEAARALRRRRRRAWGAFVLGFVLGALGLLFVALWRPGMADARADAQRSRCRSISVMLPPAPRSCAIISQRQALPASRSEKDYSRPHSRDDAPC